MPEIAKAFQFRVTRIERYIVACYDAAERGHFRAHRDNTTKGTAHRRFAVTVNLYDGCDGGELWFPQGWPAVSAEMTPDLSHSSGRSRAAARTRAGPPAEARRAGMVDWVEAISPALVADLDKLRRG